MKKPLIILCFLFSIISYSQGPDSEPTFPIYKGCECSYEPDTCFSNKLLEFVKTKLAYENIDSVLNKIKSNGLLIDSKLTFNSLGNLIEYSVISGNKKIDGILHNKFKSFPSISIAKELLDEKNQITISNKLNFNIEKSHYSESYSVNPVKKSYIPLDVLFKDKTYEIEEASIEEVKEKEEEAFPIFILERAPVYSGCNEDDCNDKLKECMSKKITKHIGRNFNTDLAAELDLPSGKQRIRVLFEINKYGETANIRVKAPHPRLEEEARRLIESIPKFTSPGFQRGKFVSVKYSLPIGFVVE